MKTKPKIRELQCVRKSGGTVSIQADILGIMTISGYIENDIFHSEEIGSDLARLKRYSEGDFSAHMPSPPEPHKYLEDKHTIAIMEWLKQIWISEYPMFIKVWERLEEMQPQEIVNIGFYLDEIEWSD